MKNLDQATASLFSKFCSACVFLSPDGGTILDARVPSLEGNAASNSLKEYGIDFDVLNRLNEHGLIISDYNSWYDYRMTIGIKADETARVFRVPFRFQNRHWVLIAAATRKPSKEYRVSGVALTRSGRELAKIIDLETMDNFSQALSRFFQGQGLKMVEVETHEPLVL